MLTNVGRTVLVTGAGRYLGTRIAARLADDPGIARVLAVDTDAPPAGAPLGRAEFVRADIGHPRISAVLEQAEVDTIVHTAFAQDERSGGEHLAGGLALLTAARSARSVARIVAASTTSVYGAARSDPAVFTESDGPTGDLPAGAPRDAASLEAALRAFARRHPHVTVAMARLAAVLGPGVDDWLSRYLALPVAPTSLGFDPRLQFLHEHDAVESLVRLTGGTAVGAINVAGSGVLTLSQTLRVCGRASLPLVPPVLRAVRVLRPEVRPLLRFGRVVDTTRLTAEIGYLPRYTTAEALYAYVDARPGLPGIAGLAVAAVAGAQRAMAR